MRRPIAFSPATRVGLSESKLKTARALSIVEPDPLPAGAEDAAKALAEVYRLAVVAAMVDATARLEKAADSRRGMMALSRSTEA